MRKIELEMPVVGRDLIGREDWVQLFIDNFVNMPKRTGAYQYALVAPRRTGKTSILMETFNRLFYQRPSGDQLIPLFFNLEEMLISGQIDAFPEYYLLELYSCIFNFRLGKRVYSYQDLNMSKALELSKTYGYHDFLTQTLEMMEYKFSCLAPFPFQLNGVTDEFLDTLIGRGDFVLTSSGYKCLEFNIAANIGGLHLPFWAVPYFENPIILRFLKENHIKIKDRDVIDIFLEHLVAAAGETLTITGSQLNIAIVAKKRGEAPGETNEPDDIEITINRRYAETLYRLDKKLPGSMIFCDFDDLTVRDDGLYHEDQPVHVLVESYEGAVPPEIMHLFKTRRICLFNGPVTGLMSNKLNLALLSEHEDSPLYNEAEREAIKTYIPWTRKILPSETFYKGEKIQLVDFIRQNREQLVMKPAVGYGGEGVAVGKYTSQNQWETVLQTAL
jgi:hypothetical protein